MGPNTPIVFALVGDVGQTENSNQTMQHILADKRVDVLIFIVYF